MLHRNYTKSRSVKFSTFCYNSEAAGVPKVENWGIRILNLDGEEHADTEKNITRRFTATSSHFTGLWRKYFNEGWQMDKRPFPKLTTIAHKTLTTLIQGEALFINDLRFGVYTHFAL